MQVVICFRKNIVSLRENIKCSIKIKFIGKEIRSAVGIKSIKSLYCGMCVKHFVTVVHFGPNQAEV